MSPVAGMPVTAPFALSVQATDNVGVVRVDLLVNGALLDSRASAPHEFNVPSLPAGSESLTVAAYDAMGNAGVATLQLGTGQTDQGWGLSVQFLSPENNATVPANTLLPLTIITSTRTTEATLSLNGQVIDRAGAPPYAFSAMLPTGVVTLQVDVADAQGRRASASVVVTAGDGGPSSPAPTPTGPQGGGERFIGQTACSLGPGPAGGHCTAIVLLLLLLAHCRRRRAMGG
jgi:hypothetical protein